MPHLRQGQAAAGWSWLSVSVLGTWPPLRRLAAGGQHHPEGAALPVAEPQPPGFLFTKALDTNPMIEDEVGGLVKVTTVQLQVTVVDV